MKTNKGMTIKMGLAERLDEMRLNELYIISYSDAIEQLFKIKENYEQLKEDHKRLSKINDQLLERANVLRLAKNKKKE